jgi:hypothetical protein
MTGDLLRPAGHLPAGHLLDLGFAKFDVLLRHRVVFLFHELLGLGAGILLGDVEIAGVGARHQLDLDHGRFGHRGTFDDRNAALPQVARTVTAAGEKSRKRGAGSRSV